MCWDRLAFFRKSESDQKQSKEPASLTLNNVPCVDRLWYTPSSTALEQVLLVDPGCQDMLNVLAQEIVKTAPAPNFAQFFATQAAAAELIRRQEADRKKQGEQKQLEGASKTAVVDAFNELIKNMVDDSRDAGRSSVVAAGVSDDTRSPYSCAAFRTALLSDNTLVQQLRLPASKYGDPRDVLQIVQELGSAALQGGRFTTCEQFACLNHHDAGYTPPEPKIATSHQILLSLPGHASGQSGSTSLQELITDAFEPKLQDDADYNCSS